MTHGQLFYLIVLFVIIVTLLKVAAQIANDIFEFLASIVFPIIKLSLMLIFLYLIYLGIRVFI